MHCIFIDLVFLLSCVLHMNLDLDRMIGAAPSHVLTLINWLTDWLIDWSGSVVGYYENAIVHKAHLIVCCWSDVFFQR